MQEARARSIGLLGKKWGTPPASELVATASPPSSIIRANPKENTQKTMMPRKSIGIRGDPTVTINTKEALADVFGMYNSPDKTIVERPGSKHAPVKKVEPATPAPVPKRLSKELIDGENASSVKTPGAFFFV